MANPPRRTAGLLFVAAAVLAAVGVLVPLIGGRAPSGALLAFVGICMALGIAMIRSR